MDSIRQAVELARAGNQQLRPSGRVNDVQGSVAQAAAEVVELNPAHLEAMRIVAHADDDRHAHYYGMLRTQVLQEMDQHGWQFLAITSATPGCGKSVTACNLAMSISRLAGRSVMLVDLDLRKPRVCQYLGLENQQGILTVLGDKASLSDVTTEVHAGSSKVVILPGQVSKRSSGEWMASQAMSTLLQTIKREHRSRIVIFDMPPVLVGDDVISILPQMEAIILVAGVGSSTVSEIKECRKHLKDKPVVRVILNRVPETSDDYFGYGYC